LASHWALGGTTPHSASQLPEQVASQEARHSESLVEQLPLQFTSHRPWQDARQSKDGGSALHSPSHEAEQEPPQSTEALALHSPAQPTRRSAAQAACTEMGVHCTSH
jgi:hypothetical protein